MATRAEGGLDQQGGRGFPAPPPDGPYRSLPLALADPETPYEETLAAFDALKKAGKIRAIGCSNLDASQLAESLKVAKDKGLPRYDVLQPEYNLYTRDKFEGSLADLCIAEDIGVITYFSLASVS